MSLALDSKSEVFQWVKRALKCENVTVNNVFFNGNTAKGEGYTGDIYFVAVQATTNDGKSTEYDLVIKASIQDEKLRQQVPVTKMYKNEINVYQRLVPEFQKFQRDKNLEPFAALPKCIDAFLLENREVIVFENLKTLGYYVNNMHNPMNENHRKLTLQAYGKWHALSFALRDQKPEVFTKLVSTSNTNTFKECLKYEVMRGLCKGSEILTCDILKERKEYVLLKKFQKKLEKGSVDVFNELLTEGEKDEYSVYTHGDCWNNNFMFKYEENDTKRKNPTQVCLLDFQVSSICSLAFDLSYHLYSCTPTKEIPNINQQLVSYHKYLSERLKELGSDPTKVFPFSKFVEHWKKYSILGVLFALIGLPPTMVEMENKPVWENVTEDTSKQLAGTLRPDVMKQLHDRMIGIVRHNLDSNFN